MVLSSPVGSSTGKQDGKKLLMLTELLYSKRAGTTQGNLGLEAQGSVCGCLVAKLCLTLGTPWTLDHQGSSVHGILQARILEWVAISPGDLPRFEPRKTQRLNMGLLYFRQTLYHLSHQLKY